MIYTVGEVAKQLNVAPSTLRYYDKEGLLPFVERSGGCMEGDSKIDERLALIESQHDAVMKQMKETQEMLDMLNYKCWYYETAKKAGTCAVHDNIEIENVPKKYHKYLTKNIKDTESIKNHVPW